MKFLAAVSVSSSVLLLACVGDVKTDVSSKTPTTAVETADAGRSAKASRSSDAAERDLCALVTIKEASDLAGLPIDRAEKKPNGCEWYANASARQQQGADAVRGAFQQLTKQEPKNAQEGVRAMESMLSGMRGAASPATAVFGVTAQWENGDQGEAMMKGTVAVNSGGAPGGQLEPVEGLGDRAYWGPMGSFLLVRKGPAVLMFGSALGSRDRAVAIARLIVQRIP